MAKSKKQVEQVASQASKPSEKKGSLGGPPLSPPVLPTDTETRTFDARGVEGRGGDGPCVVQDKGTVMLPNGDFARNGDTFDPVVEGMSYPRFRQLVDGKHVLASKSAETKLLKEWDKKGKADFNGGQSK